MVLKIMQYTLFRNIEKEVLSKILILLALYPF